MIYFHHDTESKQFKYGWNKPTDKEIADIELTIQEFLKDLKNKDKQDPNFKDKS